MRGTIIGIAGVVGMASCATLLVAAAPGRAQSALKTAGIVESSQVLSHIPAGGN
jgi:hypothetical protein